MLLENVNRRFMKDLAIKNIFTCFYMVYSNDCLVIIVIIIIIIIIIITIIIIIIIIIIITIIIIIITVIIIKNSGINCGRVLSHINSMLNGCRRLSWNWKMLTSKRM